jgi:hypothetical protein
MANRLKQITTKAKALYKTGRYAKWTDAIKAASKQTASVGATKKKAAKKASKKVVKKAAVKKAAPKKKAAAKSYHKDSKSHNVRISVVSGIENDKMIRKLSSKFLKMTGYNQLAKDVLKKHIPISNVIKAVDYSVNEQYQKVQKGTYSKALKEKSIKVKHHWDAYKKAYLK